MPDNPPLGVRIVTEDGEILYVNRSLLDIYGCRNIDELKSTPMRELYAPGSHAGHPKRKPRRKQVLFVPECYETSVPSRDGHVRHLRVHRHEVVWGKRTDFLCISEDITERKQALEKLKALLRRLLKTQEDERRNIADELHGEISQSLAALKLLLERQTASAKGALRSGLMESSKLTGEILQWIRRFSMDLYPKMLDDLGLLSTLAWDFRRYSEQTGVKVVFKHSGINQAFDRDFNSNVYRIARQALTNVARHASVDKVTVRAKADGAGFILKIEDHGIGFDPAGRSVSDSCGLEEMKERARLLGGSLTIDSALGRGTRLLLEVPLHGHGMQAGDE